MTNFGRRTDVSSGFPFRTTTPQTRVPGVSMTRNKHGSMAHFFKGSEGDSRYPQTPLPRPLVVLSAFCFFFFFLFRSESFPNTELPVSGPRTQGTVRYSADWSPSEWCRFFYRFLLGEGFPYQNRLQKKVGTRILSSQIWRT